MASEPLLPVVLFFRGLHPVARAFDAALVRVMKLVMEHLEHFIGVGVLPPTPPRSCSHGFYIWKLLVPQLVHDRQPRKLLPPNEIEAKI
ncbi:hypothetical protein PoB_001150800 [Plakobranchus ocellatus]|uniref:Uncharacterized protein n=1 Tax=Plakobranchus ocellatus TaxID=259542 RepID=A0AAV3YRN1_9GAST|nr:hypothetical protein PoB_001150800 [Plakobranchus ocellatus]